MSTRSLGRMAAETRTAKGRPPRRARASSSTRT